MEIHKEKAEQLVEMFCKIHHIPYTDGIPYAKLHVNEMIKDLMNYQVYSSPTVKKQVINQWISVLTELNKI